MHILLQAAYNKFLPDIQYVTSRGRKDTSYQAMLFRDMYTASSVRDMLWSYEYM